MACEGIHSRKKSFKTEHLHQAGVKADFIQPKHLQDRYIYSELLIIK